MAEEPSREHGGDTANSCAAGGRAQNIAGHRLPVLSLCHGEVPLT